MGSPFFVEIYIYYRIVNKERKNNIMPMKKSFGGVKTRSGTFVNHSSRRMNESQRRCAEAMFPKMLPSVAKNKSK